MLDPEFKLKVSTQQKSKYNDKKLNGIKNVYNKIDRSQMPEDDLMKLRERQRNNLIKFQEANREKVKLYQKNAYEKRKLKTNNIDATNN